MQTVTIDLIPQDELPVIKVSQYNDNWDIKFIITENGEEVQVHPDDVVTCVIRKPDTNIVTIDANEPYYGNGAVISLTEQACACYGKAFGELVIESVIGGVHKRVGTCNFILDVEISPEYGGIYSASEINNLTRQVDAIITRESGTIVEEVAGPIVRELVPEVIGDNYYTKAQTDNAINAAFNKAKFYTLLAGETSLSFVVSGIESTDIIDFKVNELNVLMPDITAVPVTGGIQYTLTFDSAFDHDVSIAFIKYSYNLIT